MFTLKSFPKLFSASDRNRPRIRGFRFAQNKTLRSRRESNSHLKLRRLALYPLSYESNAERARFELAWAFWTPKVFETWPFSRSGTFPLAFLGRVELPSQPSQGRILSIELQEHHGEKPRFLVQLFSYKGVATDLPSTSRRKEL